MCLASGKRPKARVWTAKAVARWKVTGQRPGPVMVWPPSLAGAFLDYAQAHDIVLYAMYLLILHRALRRGEACGLRDHDVDLDNAHLTIIKQITTVGYRPITTDVKSDAGDRVIPLGPTTVAALRDYLTMRERWQQVCGAGPGRPSAIATPEYLRCCDDHWNPPTPPSSSNCNAKTPTPPPT